jgi:thioesterase-3
MMNFEIFHYRLMIKEHHLDSFGHVNNATYLEILEEARWDFITERGFGLTRIHEMGIGPVILEWNIKFLKELRLRQSIIIKSQTQSYRKKIGVMRQDIFTEQQEHCCTAQMTFGLFDLQKRKLITPSEAWFEAVGAKTSS